MNGSIVQDRIYAGYGKTADKVGLQYAHYRSASPLTPIADANKLAPINITWSTLTRPFVAMAKWSDETWIGWADGRRLQPLDILIGPDGTFYVGDMQPNLPIQVVRCTHTATKIERPDPTLLNPVLIASGLPICLKLKSVNVKTPFGGTTTTAGIGVSNWLAFIPMAQHTLKRNDVITDDEGEQYEVDAPAWTPMGYVAQVRLASA